MFEQALQVANAPPSRTPRTTKTKRKKKSSGSVVGALFPHGFNENCMYGIDAYGKTFLLSDDDMLGYSGEEGGLDFKDYAYE